MQQRRSKGKKGKSREYRSQDRIRIRIQNKEETTTNRRTEGYTNPKSREEETR
jgi:hypothetical protein